MENKQSDDIARSFAAINAGRAAAADRLVTPVWYHPILGVMAAGYLVALTLGGTVTLIIAVVLLLIGIPALVSAYRKLTGVWIWGFSAGKASVWTTVMAIALAVSAGGMYYFHNVVGIDWPVWLLGIAVVAAVMYLGHRFDTAVRNQLRAALNSPAPEDEQ